MKIKISRHVNLHIERAGKMREQYCLTGAKYTDGLIRNCGHWCPAFREPEMHKTIINRPELADSSSNTPTDNYQITVRLKLCQEAGEIIVASEDFTDERGKSEN